MRTEGIDLDDGGELLLDLRFADDILVFATSSQQAAYLLDELVVALADVGLIFKCRQNEVANDTNPTTKNIFFFPPPFFALRMSRIAPL